MTRAILAPILIGFGVIVNFKMGAPLGPFLFALGLMSVCVLNADLFTGKAGYFWKNKPVDLFMILVKNIVVGYLFGKVISYALPELIPAAEKAVMTWEVSLPFFIKAIFCGMIMYITVEMYRHGTFLGILFGIPIFIMCGFPHCIANVITCGIASCGNDIIAIQALFIAIGGNLLGSIIINLLQYNKYN